MIQRYKTKANVGIGVGLLINIATRVTVATTDPVTFQRLHSLAIVLSMIGLVGSVLFIYGCVWYAKAKGRNGWWGAFGLLSLIGLIVLVCLKDRAKDEYVEEARGFEPLMASEASPPPLPSGEPRA